MYIITTNGHVTLWSLKTSGLSRHVWQNVNKNKFMTHFKLIDKRMNKWIDTKEDNLNFYITSSSLS